MRPLLVIGLALGLTGCAPDAAAPPAGAVQRVEVEGVITEVMPSGSDSSYILDVPGEGFLPLAITTDGLPPAARGVVVEVPADADVPADASGEFAALTALVEATGEPLAVVDFLV